MSIDSDSQNVVHVFETDELHRNCSASDDSEAFSSPWKLWNPDVLVEFLSKVFLPSGYPNSVSPVFGVGDATATATHALFLTVVQDIFSRLSTVIGAYYIGSSLVSEAKTYRLLADVMNDAAIILDTFMPLLLLQPWLSEKIPGLRLVALCISGALKSLCGIAAGGSKASLTLHFATPIEGQGDVGDLNAKDASKETVTALLGMLAGSWVVHQLTNSRATYFALFSLVATHLFLNYIGIKGVILRTLNPQRASLAWALYRSRNDARILPRAPSPTQVASQEKIFRSPGILWDVEGNMAGWCSIGTSFAATFHQRPVPAEVFKLLSNEKYVLWYDDASLLDDSQVGIRLNRELPCLHICLKEGHTSVDHLRAWLHATELSFLLSDGTRSMVVGGDTELDDLQTEPNSPLGLLQRSHERVKAAFDDFVSQMQAAAWDISPVSICVMAGAPPSVVTSVKMGSQVLEHGKRDEDGVVEDHRKER
ncbi:hypothetical protein FISHEDRAFT_68831 [Fistulina hepatica ATCC 64428]|uniref:DUF647-domain-containing protein n=1 Tax=Fistulina hepatica ATCC 64428 TaxID=1128425 RepID=A0A0D7AQ83_9AGAR|nr:hypothetical protein FISHEDRAFT_68831 [Fistulina hepatica ATCC 64428]